MTPEISIADVREACKWFDEDARADQLDYKRASAFDWGRIDEADEDDIFREGGPIWFLDRWRAFNILPMWPAQLDQSLPRMVKFAHKNARQSLEALQGLSIVRADLKDKGVAQSIRSCFYSMASVAMRFKHVAASKYLHMCIPELFVMWDTSIAMNGYGIARFPDLADAQLMAADDYVGVFLPGVQRRLRALLDEVASSTGCSSSEAADRLRSTVSDSYGIGKTCAKIIDEYNYCKYTRTL